MTGVGSDDGDDVDDEADDGVTGVESDDGDDVDDES